jgi:hypothetical protein
MVYMAAIIDWHSKAVWSYTIPDTMDSQLVWMYSIMFSGSGSDKFFWLSILPIEGALNRILLICMDEILTKGIFSFARSV